MPETESRAGGLARWWRGFVLGPLETSAREARVFLASPASRGPDARVLTVLLGTALVLTLLHYFCLTDQIDHTLGLLRRLGLGSPADAASDFLGPPGERPLRRLAW